MPKVAFTLLELILVIVLLSIFSFLVISFSGGRIEKDKIVSLQKIIGKEGNISFSALGCQNVEVYRYVGDDNFEKEVKGEEVVYFMKNGIGDALILECDDRFYLFKPFYIKRVQSLEEAETLFLDKKDIFEN